MSKIHIVGVGYSKNVSIGESFLQETVVNIWHFPPDGAFVYYSPMGTRMILEEMTKISESGYKVRFLKTEEITDDVVTALIEKGNYISPKSLLHLNQSVSEYKHDN